MTTKQKQLPKIQDDIDDDLWDTMKTVKNQAMKPKPKLVRTRNGDYSDKLKNQKVEILLIQDQRRHFSSLNDILNETYLITAPNCKHSIEASHKTDEEVAKFQGLKYYTYESAKAELPKVLPSKLHLGCKVCVDQKWLSLSGDKNCLLHIVDFKNGTESLQVKGIELHKPSGWIDQQGKNVVVNGLHSDFIVQRHDVVELVKSIVTLTKVANFATVIVEMKYRDIADKMKDKIASEVEIFSPPILSGSFKVLEPEDDIEDDVFYHDVGEDSPERQAKAIHPSIAESSSSKTSDELPLIKITSDDSTELKPLLGFKMPSGSLSYVLKQVLPTMKNAFVTDQVLWRLCQASMKYWQDVINKGNKGDLFSIGLPYMNATVLQADTIKLLIEEDQMATEFIMGHIICAFIEVSDSNVSELIFSGEDGNLLIQVV